MRYRVMKGLAMFAMVIVFCVLAGFVVMHLWNWLMPGIFGLHTITYAQAFGLLVLCRILLGGFHRHSGGRRGWRRGMQQRWAKMTPEEREQFRAGMRARRGCDWGRQREEEAK